MIFGEIRQEKLKVLTLRYRIKAKSANTITHEFV